MVWIEAMLFKSCLLLLVCLCLVIQCFLSLKQAAFLADACTVIFGLLIQDVLLVILKYYFVFCVFNEYYSKYVLFISVY